MTALESEQEKFPRSADQHAQSINDAIRSIVSRVRILGTILVEQDYACSYQSNHIAGTHIQWINGRRRHGTTTFITSGVWTPAR